MFAKTLARRVLVYKMIVGDAISSIRNEALINIIFVADTNKTVHDVEREEQLEEEYREILKKREMLLR